MIHALWSDIYPLTDIEKKICINPLVTNGLSHPYHLDESTFILGASGVILHFYFIFRWKSCQQTEKPQMGRCILRCHIWGYSVCICPIKRISGLYRLRAYLSRSTLIITGQKCRFVCPIRIKRFRSFKSKEDIHKKERKMGHTMVWLLKPHQ